MQHKLIRVQHSSILPSSQRYDFDEVVNNHISDGWKPLWETFRTNYLPTSKEPVYIVMMVKD